MKKIIALIVMAALLVLSVVGCGTTSTSSSQTTPTNTTEKKTKGFKVAVLIGQNSFSWMQQFVDDLTISLEKNKKDGTLSDYIIYQTKTDEEANAALNDALNRKVDGVMVQPQNEDSIAASVAKLVAAGIKVWGHAAIYPGTFRSDSDATLYKKIPAQYVLETMGGKGNLIEITGPPGEVSTDAYIQLNKSVIDKFPDVKYLTKAPGYYDATKTNQAVAALLASYPKIDGYIGDAGTLGAIRAFQAAKKPMPVMTGDSTNEFMRAWKSTPDLKAMIATYPPGTGHNAIEFLIRILQGKTPKASVLKPVIGRTDGALHIETPVPLYVVKEKDPNAAWLKSIDPGSKVITLDEAIKIGEGQPDTWTLDSWLTDAEVNAYFQ